MLEVQSLGQYVTRSMPFCTLLYLPLVLSAKKVQQKTGRYIGNAKIYI